MGREGHSHREGPTPPIRNGDEGEGRREKGREKREEEGGRVREGEGEKRVGE